MPPIPINSFIKAIEATVAANARYVPPSGKGALYLRPIVFGSGGKLGVARSDSFTFCVWCSPVGNYFPTPKSGAVGPDAESSTRRIEGAVPAVEMLSSVTPIKLLATSSYVRAAVGGIGFVKAIGNYAPVFKCQEEVKAQGFNEALFLDSKEGKYVEEAGASNFFAYFPNTDGTKGGKLVTPNINTNTILPGVTRDSIITLVKQEMSVDGIVVEERPLSLKELENASEAFCCGTGASITPVGSVTYNKGGSNTSERGLMTFGNKGRKAGFVTNRLYKMLYDIQWGTGDGKLSEKYKEWVLIVRPVEGVEG